MADKILMKGNEALAEAAIQAGCRHYFGYPITPQTEVAAYMAKRMPKIGGVFLQAESEIAAINMVIGAAAAGKRAMTSSSSPGISLKSEGISYMAGCDLPALIVNVQRGGPGLGGIQPSQSDYFRPPAAAVTATSTCWCWPPPPCRRWPTWSPRASIWRKSTACPACCWRTAPWAR